MYLEERIERPSEKSEGLVFCFGPLKATFKELYAEGFFLYAGGKSYPRFTASSVKIYLTNGKDRYNVGKVPDTSFVSGAPLYKHVKDGEQLLGKFSTVPVDPWVTLQDKHKRVRKKPVFVGNRTLREYLQETLVG